MVCSKNIRTNSIVYFEKNEFNYNVRKHIDINTHTCTAANYMEKKDTSTTCLWVAFKSTK